MRVTQPATALAIVMALTVTACSGDSKPTGATSAAPSNVVPSVPQFGDGCAAFPMDPTDPGSFEAMATKPVASAIQGYAGMKQLAGALKNAGLANTWNSAKAITVFAPADIAFDRVPKEELRDLLADDSRLADLLAYHTLPERLTPESLKGTHKTEEGKQILVEGQGNEIMVNNSAKVICANVQTKNGTIYVIDAMLTLNTE